MGIYFGDEVFGYRFSVYDEINDTCKTFQYDDLNEMLANIPNESFEFMTLRECSDTYGPGGNYKSWMPDRISDYKK